MPSILKTSEHLLLGGPIGKYNFEGCFHRDRQAAVFQYLDILGSLWEKTITTRQLDQLQRDIPRVLTQLAFLLPTREQDMNRHMMLHMVSAIGSNGPVWTWSMFGFEMMWNRLVQ